MLRAGQGALFSVYWKKRFFLILFLLIMDERHNRTVGDSTSYAEEDFAAPEDAAETEVSAPAKESGGFMKEANASAEEKENKNPIDQKIDELYFGSGSFKVNVSAVETYKKYNFYGPQVGEGTIVDKESGKVVPVEIHKAKGRAHEPDQEGFFLIRPDGKRIGDLYLRKDLPGGAMDKNNYGPGWDHDHFFEEDYGNGDQRLKRPPKVFIEMTEKYEAIPEQYAGVGELLTRIAVERSLQLGANGRVLLHAAFNSFGFWKKMGFVPQDVYNKDGSLHHAGEELSKKYQDRVEQMLQTFAYRIKEGASAEEIEAEKNRIIKEFGALHLRYGHLAIMYLPQEAIAEYKKNIVAHGPHLTENAMTIRALDLKHDILHQQEYDRKSLDEFLGNEKIQRLLSAEVTEENYSDFDALEKVAQLYASIGEKDSAQSLYKKLALASEAGVAWENGHNHGYFALPYAIDAAEFWEAAGQHEKALPFWEYAGGEALSKGEIENAAIYFGRAGRQDKAGQTLEQNGEVYREW